MKKYGEEFKKSQMQIPLSEFLVSFNQNMPAGFPRASAALLKKFQDAHPMLFKSGDSWSLDRHRKKLIDWLPRNCDTA